MVGDTVVFEALASFLKKSFLNGEDDMTTRKKLLVFLVIIICCHICNSNAIFAATTGQDDPGITSDGNGGAIISWKGQRTNIYAQRINDNGAVLWTTNGVAILSASTEAGYPAITSDRNGGAIISWKGQQAKIYAQRVNGSGAVLWTTNGVTINTNSAADGYPAITGDGNGGAIISWKGQQAKIYAQRVNGNGTVQWTTNGVTINTNSAADGYPAITGDGNGGAIISWKGQQANIYAQRVNGSGMVLWTTNGVTINTNSAADGYPAITGDGNGGAIISWKGQQANIYAQRVNDSGTVQWTTNGVAIHTKSAADGRIAITSDQNAGAIISWKSRQANIYAQRVNGSGTVLWTTNGVAIHTNSAADGYPAITGDGNGGAIISWKGQQANIYAQRVNDNGTVLWTTNGVAIPAASADARQYRH